MIVENATLGPLGALRKQLRQVLAACASERCAPEIGKRLEALLDAPEWEQAAEDANTLRTSLAHWKVFGEHAEGERSQLSADAARLDRFEDWLADRAGPLLHIDQIKEALK